MRRLVLVAALLLQGSLHAQVTDPSLTTFERQYKQALFQTSKDMADQAASALVAAEQAWRDIVLTAYENPGEPFEADATFEQRSAEILGRIALARMLVGAGKAAEAHDVLESIAYSLRYLRENRGIYVLNDKLTAFHAALEVIASAAADKKPAEITPELLASWRTWLPELRSRWQAALGLVEGAKAAEALRPRLDAVGGAVAKLGTALAGTDTAAVLTAVNAVRPAFQALYLGLDNPDETVEEVAPKE